MFTTSKMFTTSIWFFLCLKWIDSYKITQQKQHKTTIFATAKKWTWIKPLNAGFSRTKFAFEQHVVSVFSVNGQPSFWTFYSACILHCCSVLTWSGHRQLVRLVFSVFYLMLLVLVSQFLRHGCMLSQKTKTAQCKIHKVHVAIFFSKFILHAKICGDKRQHRQLVKHGQICARMTAQINSHLPTIPGSSLRGRPTKLQ